MTHFAMIDLHCHLLPGIDDGPSTTEESLAMARVAVADGIGTVAVTPHLRDDHPGVRPRELADRVDSLRAALRREEIPLELAIGGEVDIFWAARATPEELRMASFGGAGRVLLIETPHGFLSDVFEELLADVVGRGYRVLLAHPERNQSFQASPDRLEELAYEGILLQVNAGSVIREARDPDARNLASRLLRRRMIHALASDSHGPGPWRPPNLARAHSELARAGDPQASWLVADAPAAILAGHALPPRPERRADLFDRFVRRRVR